MKNIYLLALTTFIMLACDSARIHETYRDMPRNTWNVNEPIVFLFKVEDITKPCNLYYTLRHTASYPNYNIHVEYEIVSPSGKSIAKQTQEGILFDETTGEPQGSGVGDLFTNELLILTNHTFTEVGEYKLILRQRMRLDNLPEIASVGMRLENAEE